MESGPHTTSLIYAGSKLFETIGFTMQIIIRREPGAVEEECVPNYFPTNGLVDTGASDCCIDIHMARSLKLIEVDQTDAIGFGGVAQHVPVFMADVELPQIGFRGMVNVLGSKVLRSGSAHGALIGRTILKNYICTFDGPAGCFTFYNPSAPHMGSADFDE